MQMAVIRIPYRLLTAKLFWMLSAILLSQQVFLPEKDTSLPDGIQKLTAAAEDRILFGESA